MASMQSPLALTDDANHLVALWLGSKRRSSTGQKIGGEDTEMSECCVIEKALCIETVFECVRELVNVTYTVCVCTR